MTLDNFTIKAQETIQEAMNVAQRSGQQTIEPTHLLKGVLTKAKDITNFLFQKMGVNGQHVEQLVDSELQHQPRVQGGQPYLSNDANQRRWATSSSAWNLLYSLCSTSTAPQAVFLRMRE